MKETYFCYYINGQTVDVILTWYFYIFAAVSVPQVVKVADTTPPTPAETADSSTNAVNKTTKVDNLLNIHLLLHIL